MIRETFKLASEWNALNLHPHGSLEWLSYIIPWGSLSRHMDPRSIPRIWKSRNFAAFTQEERGPDWGYLVLTRRNLGLRCCALVMFVATYSLGFFLCVPLVIVWCSKIICGWARSKPSVPLYMPEALPIDKVSWIITLPQCTTSVIPQPCRSTQKLKQNLVQKFLSRQDSRTLFDIL